MTTLLPLIETSVLPVIKAKNPRQSNFETLFPARNRFAQAGASVQMGTTACVSCMTSLTADACCSCCGREFEP